jgi:hypothetical protein
MSIFTAGMMLLILPLSWLADHIMADQNLPELLDKHPKVLLLGDSHARTLGEAVHGDNICDLSYDSDSYLDILAKLMFCVENETIPDAVLLECDLHMFSNYRLETNGERRTVELIGYAAYAYLYDGSFGDYVLHRYIYSNLKALDANNAPLIRSWLKSRLVGLFVEAPPGLAWCERSESERQRLTLGRFHEQFDQPCEDRLQSAFRDIIALCRQHQIEVIGLRFPLSPEYNDLLADVSLECVEEVLMSGNIPIIEVSREFDRAEYFKDCDHLNGEGIELYRAALVQELDRRQLKRFFGRL